MEAFNSIYERLDAMDASTAKIVLDQFSKDWDLLVKYKVKRRGMYLEDGE